MGYKRSPSRLAIAQSNLANLPRRALGRPLMDPRAYDPEICGSFYEGYIDAAFPWVRTRVTNIKNMGGECLKLGNCLDGKSVASVYITCANCAGGGDSSSRAADQSLQLCLANWGTALTQPTVNGVVFRELVRMCGGTDLDAWALYYYFTAVVHGPGGTVYYVVPVPVRDLMCAGSTPLQSTGSFRYYRIGTFMVWNTWSGALYPKQLVPGGGAAQTGISWVTPSLTGMSNPDWQHMCP